MPEHPLKIFEELDPKLLDLVNKTKDLAFADGALPRKTKLLIAMVLDAVSGASDGVQSLARLAIKEGATKEEIAESLRVAQYICGVGCVYTAATALKEILKWCYEHFCVVELQLPEEEEDDSAQTLETTAASSTRDEILDAAVQSLRASIDLRSE